MITNTKNLFVLFSDVIGVASYVVLLTDYQNYAGVFSCQQLAFAHRRSATILSRTPFLNHTYLETIHKKLEEFNINPFDLSMINHEKCSEVSSETTNISMTDLHVPFNKETIKLITENSDEFKMYRNAKDDAEWLP
ncbi:hypothetical protein Phum_PHUM448350 [Pediculus humanus corporis]|uniref:Uncharacterized protein n=1 Tax=Pediculus humanus subsp. corporis TaxID=121224 RepID=E0VU91_PEDHC|nr:uncharacterized protein Phum_PHUM448350 [Pediculus humanus corporis]EEB16947.1 hypothetical protein Phum_PHUM448350 [Pediculus humanus corporis]